jgi:hypothetical protein
VVKIFILHISNFSVITVFIIMTTFGHAARRYERELLGSWFPDMKEIVNRPSRQFEQELSPVNEMKL